MHALHDNYQSASTQNAKMQNGLSAQKIDAEICIPSESSQGTESSEDKIGVKC